MIHLCIFQISSLVTPNPPNEIGWSNCTKIFRNLTSCTAIQQELIMGNPSSLLVFQFPIIIINSLIIY